jgi:hypothetical protein
MRSGDHLSKQGKYQEAEAVYLKAMEMARKSSLEAIARGVLLKFYEQNNADEKALEQVDWFLTGGDPNAPMRQELLETKQRLLQKIAEKNKDPMGQFKENVRQLKPEAQKEFVQSLSDTKIMGQFKQAMEAEQRNDFAGALVIYESLLRQKEFVVKEMGIHAWVMLYPGIQRTAELSGNSEKEKEALIWINANLLNPAGGYHQSLSYLEARSITHLKERIKVLGENS